MVRAKRRGRETGGPTRSLRPIEDGAFGVEEARHLLNRAGFGGDAAQVRTVAAWGPKRAVEHLVRYDAVAYDQPMPAGYDARIMAPLSPEEQARYRTALRNRDEEVVAAFRARIQQAQARDREQIAGLQRWWLTRMIETPRPLEEKMTLFWHGHFATSYRTIENSHHMLMQNEMFRKEAAGNFARLLFGIIRDPAMLAYLNNNASRKGEPNENLARELMELFSLGVGGYSEDDIKEGARALTGYTFEGDEFVFRRDWHDNGEKRILGKRGALDGDDFARAILEERRCSEFIAARLYRFFVADLPEKMDDIDPATRQVIDDLARTLRTERYELKPALERLFLSEHFYDEAFRGQQIKSPAQLVVQGIRSLRAPARDLGALTDAMELMGQDLFFPPSVAGWDGGRSWINTSTLFVRQNVMTYLLTGRKTGGFDARAAQERFDPTWLVEELERGAPGASRDPAALCEYLLRAAVGRPAASAGWAGTPAHEQLLAFMAAHDNRVTPDLVTGLLALITAMPEYQLC
ncbi:MAG: DUF1800 domain-containing protein [Planctomycetota bacterium]|nr:DUF1800 domain-containing protein [Planctomycetota bacterium]